MTTAGAQHRGLLFLGNFGKSIFGANGGCDIRAKFDTRYTLEGGNAPNAIKAYGGELISLLVLLLATKF